MDLLKLKSKKMNKQERLQELKSYLNELIMAKEPKNPYHLKIRDMYYKRTERMIRKLNR